MGVMNHKASRSRTGLVFGTITGLFLGMVGLLSAPSAQGMTVSVCGTGFTGDPAYDRECLTRGTREDAAVAWYVGYTDGQRNVDCRAAKRQGMVAVVRETRGDVLTDNFRNGQQMIEWTARMGTADCQARGF
jgi:hypothetical protein